MLNFEELNYLAIILAAVAKFMVGGLWFSKFLFGESWMEEVGLKVEELTNPTKPMIIAFLGGLLVAFSMAILLNILALDLRTSFAVVVILAIGISAAQVAQSFAFEGRSMRLYLIYATQTLAEFLVVAAILLLM